MQAELSEDGDHSDDESDEDDAAEREKLLVSLSCLLDKRLCTLPCLATQPQDCEYSIALVASHGQTL